ncbi:heavy-metal-associated domain-containing protein [Rubrobacter radiotolerans]|uniref:Cation transporter n=1 Tax=Rubrobacter radiotolerans TaxID=42256 RepID=A0AB35TA05_RUBRA|nr:cation transporter [Rubrobacter radiotolerans]MDX5895163.1 cation transporter [Rubrobacter radiotolerans]SMC07572.1 copper chaperone [Rubrobacter radiotolerans DSM 5868]
MTEKTFRVEGMSCGHCEMSVQEELEELDGVKSAKADHVEGTVVVAYEEGRVTGEQFRAAVEEAGYELVF